MFLKVGCFRIYTFLWIQGIEMAKLLESQIKKDPNFEIPAKRHLGLVVFSLTVFKLCSKCILRDNI